MGEGEGEKGKEGEQEDIPASRPASAGQVAAADVSEDKEAAQAVDVVDEGVDASEAARAVFAVAEAE